MKTNNSKDKGQKLPKQEGNKYDKILHEIGDAAILPIVADDLNIQIHKITYKKAKMQTTLEREVDECYWIETEDGGELILHVEYQSQDDHKMVLRVNLYVAMIRYYYPEKEIISVVVYVGKGKPTMRTQLLPHEIFTGFEMIIANELDHKKLLSSSIPEKVIMTIFADYELDHAKDIIHKIIARLRVLCETEKELVKCCKQLQIFSFLRNLEELTKEILGNMAVYINIVDSPLFKDAFEPERIEYRRRIEEERIAKEEEKLAKDQAIHNSILSLLKYSSLDVSEIAQSLKVEIELVLKIKQEHNL